MIEGSQTPCTMVLISKPMSGSPFSLLVVLIVAVNDDVAAELESDLCNQ